MSDLIHISEVARLVGRSEQTLAQWDKWSDEEEAQGRPRLIPKPVHMGSGRGKGRYWTPEQVEQIRQFAANLRHGDLARFTRKKYGKYYPNRNR